jgi:hypothetical protein
VRLTNAQFITMRTIVNIPDAMHTQARIYAASNKTTLAALVNEGLASLLKRKQAKNGNPLRLRKGSAI